MLNLELVAALAPINISHSLSQVYPNFLSSQHFLRLLIFNGLLTADTHTAEQRSNNPTFFQLKMTMTLFKSIGGSFGDCKSTLIEYLVCACLHNTFTVLNLVTTITPWITFHCIVLKCICGQISPSPSNHRCSHFPPGLAIIDNK